MKSAGKKDIGTSNYILQCPSANSVLEKGKSNKLLMYLPVMKMLKTDHPSSQECKGLELSGGLEPTAYDDSLPFGIAFVLEGPHTASPQPAQHLFLECINSGNCHGWC